KRVPDDVASIRWIWSQRHCLILMRKECLNGVGGSDKVGQPVRISKRRTPLKLGDGFLCDVVGETRAGDEIEGVWPQCLSISPSRGQIEGLVSSRVVRLDGKQSYNKKHLPGGGPKIKLGKIIS